MVSHNPDGQNLPVYGPDDLSPGAKRLRTAILLDSILDDIALHPLDKRYVLRNDDGARIPITTAGVRRLLQPEGEDPGTHVIAAIAARLTEIAQEYVEGAVPMAYYGFRRDQQRELHEDMAEAREATIRELRDERAAWLAAHPEERLKADAEIHAWDLEHPAGAAATALKIENERRRLYLEHRAEMAGALRTRQDAADARRHVDEAGTR